MMGCEKDKLGGWNIGNGIVVFGFGSGDGVQEQGDAGNGN